MLNESRESSYFERLFFFFLFYLRYNFDMYRGTRRVVCYVTQTLVEISSCSVKHERKLRAQGIYRNVSRNLSNKRHNQLGPLKYIDVTVLSRLSWFQRNSTMKSTSVYGSDVNLRTDFRSPIDLPFRQLRCLSSVNNDRRWVRVYFGGSIDDAISRKSLRPPTWLWSIDCDREGNKEKLHQRNRQ